MVDKNVFDIYAWDKLINEVDTIENVLMMRDAKIENLAQGKETITFFKDNLEKIYPHCKDTDFMRIKKLWLEIKDPKKKNTETMFFDQIQNILKTLNL